jgi:PAB1-binding protein PBP1
LYSTKIDNKKVDKKMQDKAMKLEKEITSLQSNNKHVRQERGQEEYNEIDETGKYTNEEMEHSGVYRNTENKPKHRFTCFNTPSAKKDSKF